MSNLSISGAVSGVDTASIINSLVSVQQNQQTLLKKQQSTQSQAATAYGTLLTALGSLGSLSSTLANTSAWKGATASSSSTTVTATSTSNTSASLTFDVTAVARSHALISNESVASLGTTVASGPLTVTRADGSTTTVAVGSGSLSDVVSAINGSSTGLSAAAVQVAPGQYRLQVASTSTGAASSFSVGGLDGFTAMNVLSQGQDAQVTVGTDPRTQFTATSSTNTFSSLVPGMSFTVSKVESGVTVKSSVDGSAVADDVQKLVDAANTVLSTISSTTAWDATNKTGGPLVGDSASRSLQQQILTMVGGAGAPGVSVTKDGQVTFDRSSFLTSYAKDPVGTAAKFGATTAFTPATGVTGGVSYSSATTTTQPGSYDVSVSSLAQTEQWTVDTGSGLAAGQVISLSRGTSTVSYTVSDTDTADSVLTNLNAALTSAGFGVSATAGGNGILLTADRAGTIRSFTAALDGADQAQVTAGADVQGSIDGQTATGVGSVLSLGSGTGGAVGLSVNVGLTQADLDASGGSIGSVSYRPGLAQQLNRLVQQQTASGTGVLASAQKGRQDRVKQLQTQIDDWDTRLETYRAMLQKQFTAMETAIAALKSQSSFLSGNASSSAAASSSGSSSG